MRVGGEEQVRGESEALARRGAASSGGGANNREMRGV